MHICSLLEHQIEPTNTGLVQCSTSTATSTTRAREEVEEEHQVLCLSLEPVGRLVLLCLNLSWYLGCRSDRLGISLLEDLGLEEAE